MFYGLTIWQEEGTGKSSGDEKLMTLKPYSMSRPRRQKLEESLNAIGLYSYRSGNDTLRLIGSYSSPSRSFAIMYLEQGRPDPVVKVLK